MAAVAAMVEQWHRDTDLVVLPVSSDVAFHTRHMDALVDDLAGAVQNLTPAAPRVPFYTSASNDPRANEVRDVPYWIAHLRNPVRFSAAVVAALHDDYRTFVEISAHTLLATSIVGIVAATGVDHVVAAHTLRRDEPERAVLLENLAPLRRNGVAIGPGKQ